MSARMESIEKKYGFCVRITAAILAVIAVLALLPVRTLAADPAPVHANQALLGDLDSGRILYAQNIDEQMIPASTTKVLTAMLIIEAIERGELGENEKVTARQQIIDGVVYDASRVKPYIVDGEALTVREYLDCIMLGSDCVACDILADRLSGSVENFVKLMNDRALELGCTNTNFVNTHGYPADGHYTNAVSLFRIMRQAMQYELFRDIISTIKLEIPKTDKSEPRMLYNSNWMIWNPEKITSIYTPYYYPYSIGGKTGSSNKSGHCLVSCAYKDGVTLIAVVTGAKNEIVPETGKWTNRSFSESQRLFEWGFDNFSMRTVVTSGSDAGRQTVSGGDAEDVRVVTLGELSVLIPNEAEPVQAERRNVYFSRQAEAPVSPGDVLGHMEVYYDGDLCGSVELVAAEGVKLTPKKAGKEKDSKNNLPILILVTLVVFVGAAVLYITNTKKIIIQDYYSKNKTHSRAAGAPVNRSSAVRHAQNVSGSRRYPPGISAVKTVSNVPAAGRQRQPVQQQRQIKTRAEGGTVTRQQAVSSRSQTMPHQTQAGTRQVHTGAQRPQSGRMPNNGGGVVSRDPRAVHNRTGNNAALRGSHAPERRRDDTQ